MRALLLTLALLAACKDDSSKLDDTGVPQSDDSSATDDSATDDSAADDSAADDSATDDSATDDTAPPEDLDGDGVLASEDCNDSDPNVYPGAAEHCDGVDEDCDGQIDNDAIDASISWADRDRDGYGDLEQRYDGCETIEDSADNADDCDDTDPAINPGATEVCDPDQVDEDCNGLSDDDDAGVDASGFTAWYRDGDRDGYGDPDSAATHTCHATGTRVDNADDCDDGDANVYPGNGCETSWDGSYTGSFTVTVTVTNFGLSDTCSGTGSFTVATADATPISGTYTCSFAGLGASLLGSQTITLDGTIPSDPSASGNLAVGSVISDTWTGSFASPGTLSGTFSGSGTYSSYSLTWTGSFNGTR